MDSGTLLEFQTDTKNAAFCRSGFVDIKSRRFLLLMVCVTIRCSSGYEAQLLETQLAQNRPAQRNEANMLLIVRRSLTHCIPRQSHGTRDNYLFVISSEARNLV